MEFSKITYYKYFIFRNTKYGVLSGTVETLEEVEGLDKYSTDVETLITLTDSVSVTTYSRSNEISAVISFNTKYYDSYSLNIVLDSNHTLKDMYNILYEIYGEELAKKYYLTYTKSHDDFDELYVDGIYDKSDIETLIHNILEE